MTSGALPKTLRTLQIQLLMSRGGRYSKLSLDKDTIIISLSKSKLGTGVQDGNGYFQSMWLQSKSSLKPELYQPHPTSFS